MNQNILWERFFSKKPATHIGTSVQTGGFTVLSKPQPSNCLPFLNPCNMYLNSTPENVDYLTPSTFHLALKRSLLKKRLILQNLFSEDKINFHFLLHDLATKMFPPGSAKWRDCYSTMNQDGRRTCWLRICWNSKFVLSVMNMSTENLATS